MRLSLAEELRRYGVIDRKSASLKSRANRASRSNGQLKRFVALRQENPDISSHDAV